METRGSGSVLPNEGSGTTTQRQCPTQRQGLGHEGGGTMRQRQGLGHEGGGIMGQRQGLDHEGGGITGQRQGLLSHLKLARRGAARFCRRACTEPGGSACCYRSGYGTQCNHPAQGRAGLVSLGDKEPSASGTENEPAPSRVDQHVAVEITVGAVYNRLKDSPRAGRSASDCVRRRSAPPVREPGGSPCCY